MSMIETPAAVNCVRGIRSLSVPPGANGGGNGTVRTFERAQEPEETVCTSRESRIPTDGDRTRL